MSAGLQIKIEAYKNPELISTGVHCRGIELNNNKKATNKHRGGTYREGIKGGH